VALVTAIAAQVENDPLLKVVRAEDELRWNKDLENLLKSPSEQIRVRAALAAGRIGDDRAIPALSNILEKDSVSVRTMAAFAIGEIESSRGADPIFNVLLRNNLAPSIRARAIEAAGKIAAANSGDPLSKLLGESILTSLEEEAKRIQPDKLTLLLGLTAIIRARPEKGEAVAARFLSNSDARIRADAANTLTRLRAKGFSEQLRTMLLTDKDGVARANAARALGASADKSAIEILTSAATNDDDERVRVSAIRALANLNDRKPAPQLLTSAFQLLKSYKKSRLKNPAAKNDLLEIAATLGKLLANSNDSEATNFLKAFRYFDGYRSPEIEIAFARISPAKYLDEFNKKKIALANWRITGSFSTALGEFANSTSVDTKSRAERFVRFYLVKSVSQTTAAKKAQLIKATPEILRAFAQFKSSDLSQILRSYVESPDVFVRATAAELLSNEAPSKENIDALKRAFATALLIDRNYDDAQLAILDALFKLDRKESVASLFVGLGAPDYLVRKKSFDLLRSADMEKVSPSVAKMLELYIEKNQGSLLPYSPESKTKLGQVLNTESDYLRATKRKNGEVRALVTTEKGKFVIELFPEDAPLTVDNFIKLARRHYFDRVGIHRVVPNFVMQDGDQRGDGNGGPGWQIRCEINLLTFDRGAVGMALSGKDTGGSQWFITHSPQPHLDGGYTVFGKVNENGMKIVDAISRGDKILSIAIEDAESQLSDRSKLLPR